MPQRRPRITLIGARWARAGLGALVLLSTLSVASHASAEVAPTSCTKTLGGTLRGEDGRYLSAFVGAVFYDGSRRPIAAASCSNPKPGYDGTDSINDTGGCCYLFGPEGSSSGQQAWAMAAPGNAAFAWVEAYPKASTTPDGPHRTTYERYGGAMRRMVPVSTGIDLRLPLGCGLGPGGDNGAIRGTILKNGVPQRVTRIAAFSRAPDSEAIIMGFGVQGQPGTADGRFAYVQLSPGQRYALSISTTAGDYWFEHDYGSGIPVSSCATTLVSIDVGYSPPRLHLLPGTTTVGVRRGVDMYLTNSPTGSSTALDYAFGALSDQILVGDWNGDGIDTLGVRRGKDFILTDQTDGSAPFTTVPYGSASDIPLVGDWDGNGTDTVGIRRGNVFHLRNSNTSGPAQVSFGYGSASDVPLVGDWNGDRTDTPGIRRGNVFHLRNSNTSGGAHLSFAYGSATDVPVIGDWDGNHTDTIGVRRGADFHLRNSNSGGGAHRSFAYGTAGDVPVVGDWDGS